MKASDIFSEWADLIEVSKSKRTANDYKQIVTKYMNDLKITDLDKVTPKALAQWINAPGKTGYARRKLVFSVVKRFHLFAFSSAYTKTNAAACVSTQTDNLTHKQKEIKRVEAFTPDEYRIIISYLDNQLMELYKLADAPSKTKSKRWLQQRVDRNRFWKAAIMLSYETGLRLTDICQLEWDCIEVDQLVVHTDKRDKRVAIPMWKEVDEAIKAIPAPMGSHCFPVEREIILHPTRRSQMSVGFLRILKDANITRKGLSFHSLRHSCLTKWSSGGLDLEHIQKLAGHSNSETTKGYIHS